MKIAVASESGKVSGHFGHCEGFTIFDAEDKRAINKESVPNPGHKPGFLPVYLSEKGVDVVIAGGMGESAMDLFNEKGIQVITGAAGDAESAVNAYLQGALKSTGAACHEHQHKGECGH